MFHKAPQSLTYTDGSANVMRLSVMGEGVSWRYDPVSPLHSSSGMYSGGTAREGVISIAEFNAIWKQAIALMVSEGKEPDGTLRMGVGWFQTRVNQDKRTCMVEHSEALKDFEERLLVMCS